MTGSVAIARHSTTNRTTTKLSDMSSETVLVTGGNSGLGLEIIRALYQSSTTYNILLGSRSLGKAEAAIRAVKSKQSTSSARIEPIQIDVEDDASISHALETVEKKFGYLDILVNNAGPSLLVCPDDLFLYCRLITHIQVHHSTKIFRREK